MVRPQCGQYWLLLMQLLLLIFVLLLSLIFVLLLIFLFVFATNADSE